MTRPASGGCVCSTCRRTRPAQRSPSRSTRPSVRRSRRGRTPALRNPGSRIARRARWSTCCSPTAARESGRSTSTRSSSRCCAERPACRARTSAGCRSPATARERDDRKPALQRQGPDVAVRAPGLARTLVAPTPRSTTRGSPPSPSPRRIREAGYFARNVRTIQVLLDRDAIHTGAADDRQPVRVLQPRARLLLLHLL